MPHGREAAIELLKKAATMPKHASPHATGSDQLAATPSVEDALSDLEHALEATLERAAVGEPGIGIRGVRANCGYMPGKTSMTVSLTLVVESHFDDLDDLVNHFGAMLAWVGSRVK